MGKLIKVVLLLGVLGAAVALGIYYMGQGGGDDATSAKQTTPEGVQVQEKYGFAPVDAGP